MTKENAAGFSVEDVIDFLNSEKRNREAKAVQQLGYSPIVVLDGGSAMMLNPNFLLQQKIGKATFDEIGAVHIQKNKLLKKMEDSDTPSMLKFLANSITQIEFELQRLWGFPEDINYHRFWEVPKCTCPKMDNEDAYPTGYYVVTGGCPVHGQSTNKE